MTKSFWQMAGWSVLNAIVLTFTINGVQALRVGAAPAQPNRAIKSSDVVFGQKLVKQPMVLTNDGQFVDVLTIEGVQMKKGVDPRILTVGALAVSSKQGTGNAIVQVRITIDGQAPLTAYSTTVFDGLPATATAVPIPCNLLPADGQPHTLTLQAAVLGTGEVTVNAGNFDIVAIRPIFIPPL